MENFPLAQEPMRFGIPAGAFFSRAAQHRERIEMVFLWASNGLALGILSYFLYKKVKGEKSTTSSNPNSRVSVILDKDVQEIAVEKKRQVITERVEKRKAAATNWIKAREEREALRGQKQEKTPQEE